jgi:glycerophosphoryl diester phosphodiesterase
MKNQKAHLLFLLIPTCLFSLFMMGCEKNIDDPVLPYTVGKVEVYAHRGARSYAPENTIPGYTTGLSIGTDWVDMDIVMSKEGEIIVSHDIRLNPDIVRGADGKFITDRLLVKSLTLEQIKQYDVGRINTASAYSKFFPAQIGMDGVSMPTLREVIKYVNSKTNKKVGFQIEFKTDPEHPDWAGKNLL